MVSTWCHRRSVSMWECAVAATAAHTAASQALTATTMEVVGAGADRLPGDPLDGTRVVVPLPPRHTQYKPSPAQPFTHIHIEKTGGRSRAPRATSRPRAHYASYSCAGSSIRLLLALYSKIEGRHAFIPCHQVGPPTAGPIEDTATCLPVSWHHATVCDAAEGTVAR